MLLSQLIKDVEYTTSNFQDIDIQGVEIDSRKILPGYLYVCIEGFTVDGHNYAQSAVDNGAVALIVQRPLDDVSVPQIVVSNSRVALSLCAATWYGCPARSLKLIAVTGTNGKTTTAHMIKRMLESDGIKTAAIGTIGTYIGQRIYTQSLTTPDPMQLHEIFRRAVNEKCQALVMEVSAHALELHKTEGLLFEAAVFTNLSQDHLDDFQTMDKYFGAKKKLFQDHVTHNVIINIDDEHGKIIADDFHGSKLTYSIHHKADIQAHNVQLGIDHITYQMTVDACAEDVDIHVPGLFNVYNSMAAVGAAKAVGMEMDAILKGLQRISQVDGRMETVPVDAPYQVIVDYAHSEDSLRNLLTAVQGFCENRSICVFGCGGDRDTTKRPLMGRVVGEMADYAVVTSDNPRTEDPDGIILMIEEGISHITQNYEKVTDRRQAIRRALEIAESGDVVVIAGKGHETYQDVMGVKHHFDDREIVREYFE